jgi:hypothetical protein
MPDESHSGGDSRNDSASRGYPGPQAGSLRHVKGAHHQRHQGRGLPGWSTAVVTGGAGALPPADIWVGRTCDWLAG